MLQLSCSVLYSKKNKLLKLRFFIKSTKTISDYINFKNSISNLIMDKKTGELS